MNKITAKQLIRINCTVTSRKTNPVTDEQMRIISEIINSPYVLDEKFFYTYKSTIEKASKLACEIYKTKPFDIGNGETAVLALLTLLDVNGYRLENYQNDLGELAESIRSGDLAKTNSWIRNHLEYNPYIMPEG